MAANKKITFHNCEMEISNNSIELNSDDLIEFNETFFKKSIFSVYEETEGEKLLNRLIIYYDSITGTKHLKFDKIVELKLASLKKMGIDFYDVQIDKINHFVYGKVRSELNTTLFAFCVDEFGILGIQCNVFNGVNSIELSKFKSILNSIKHKFPYQYSPEANPYVEKKEEEIEKTGVMLTIALVIMAVSWGIRRLVKKTQNRH